MDGIADNKESSFSPEPQSDKQLQWCMGLHRGTELTCVEGDMLGADNHEPQTFLVDFPLHEEQNKSISILRPHGACGDAA